MTLSQLDRLVAFCMLAAGIYFLVLGIFWVNIMGFSNREMTRRDQGGSSIIFGSILLILGAVLVIFPLPV